MTIEPDNVVPTGANSAFSLLKGVRWDVASPNVTDLPHATFFVAAIF